MTDATLYFSLPQVFRRKREAPAVREKCAATEAMCQAHRALMLIRAMVFKLAQEGFVVKSFSSFPPESPTIFVEPPSDSAVDSIRRQIERDITVRTNAVDTEFWFFADGVMVCWSVAKEAAK